MFNAWRKRRAEKRAAQRAADAALLWPRLWAETNGNPKEFLRLAVDHLMVSPAWRDHGDEWDAEPANPGRWAAREVNRGL